MDKLKGLSYFLLCRRRFKDTVENRKLEFDNMTHRLDAAMCHDSEIFEIIDSL